MGFIRISDVNGLCINNPLNARQNNYAWSISELGDYIYVGTGRNIIASLVKAYFNDIIVATFEWAESLGIDLVQHINLKMRYNETREYHHGGKKY